MRTREELAWAAGFFDGEGCFYCMKTMPVAVIAQNASNVEVLHKFKECVGFGRLYGPFTNRTKGDVSMRLHFTSFENTQALFVMLWPWLGTAKRAQYIRVLTKTFSFQRRRGGNTLLNRTAREARARGTDVFVIWSPYHLRTDRRLCDGRSTRLIIPPPIARLRRVV